MNDATQVNDAGLLIYTTAERVQVVDGVSRNDDGEMVGLYSGRTLAELAEEYGELTVGTVDEYNALHDAAWRTEPVPITAEQYQNMLDILPPVHWVKVGGVESFRMCERTSGAITGIYARLGDTYWTFYDRIDLPTVDLAAKVKAAYLALEVSP